MFRKNILVTTEICVDNVNIVWFSAYKLNKIEHKFMIMEVYRNSCEKNSCCIEYSKSYVEGLFYTTVNQSVNNSLFVAVLFWRWKIRSCWENGTGMEEKLFIIILSCYTVSANRKGVEKKIENIFD